MLNAIRLDVDRAMLLVIDVQEKLLPLIDGHERVVDALNRLIRGAGLFALPVVVTEQYPEGIGPTDKRLTAALDAADPTTLTKMSFSCCGDDAIRDELRRLDREQIIVCGIETHVCVQQTVLDLLSMDYHASVCADAVGSRDRLDYKMALHRMRQMGAAVTTVESVLFELCVECGTERFKSMLELIKTQ